LIGVNRRSPCGPVMLRRQSTSPAAQETAGRERRARLLVMHLSSFRQAIDLMSDTPVRRYQVRLHIRVFTRRKRDQQCEPKYHNRNDITPNTISRTAKRHGKLHPLLSQPANCRRHEQNGTRQRISEIQTSSDIYRHILWTCVRAKRSTSASLPTRFRFEITVVLFETTPAGIPTHPVDFPPELTRGLNGLHSGVAGRDDWPKERRQVLEFPRARVAVPPGQIYHSGIAFDRQ
jgi:hypothetical protein